MAANRRKQALDRFASGGDLDGIEAEILDAMHKQAVAGNAAAARVVLAAVKERRKAVAIAQKSPENDGKPAVDDQGRPVLRLRREAI